MKARIFAIGVVVLLFSIVGSGIAVLGQQADSGTTEAYWTIQDGSCSVDTFSVHADVDLGSTSSYAAGDVLDSIPSGTSSNLIELETSCSDWHLELSRDDAYDDSSANAEDKIPGDGLSDFYQWVEDTNASSEGGYGGSQSITIDATKMDGEPSVDQTSDNPFTSGQFVSGTAGSYDLAMGYKYILENDDVPGTYGVNVTYTLYKD